MQENFDFRWILNLDVPTGSGSDKILKTGSGHILKPGFGSDLISKTRSGSDKNTRIPGLWIQI